MTGKHIITEFMQCILLCTAKQLKKCILKKLFSNESAVFQCITYRFLTQILADGVVLHKALRVVRARPSGLTQSVASASQHLLIAMQVYMS